ncbi:imidazole glycerol phosphate synthase subunit HisH [Pusillimonas minor]|uniref:Imidazole glycerol phosphate synthase subunit HisH n=1 Tax=Pusillimonas minor TaxID=2697024 RepID=A0A842HNW1_9BURK|nr:imidazole glycerol phosphate synthase subunit HisH [Pusillimonas minor]MBC2770589.1 imidazole glycerol phosphate synthase subunit HisH [Pusillimonas minor]
MIGILDIGMGNLRSVHNAVYQNGFDPVVVHAAAEFDDLTHLILPGVGNFSAAVPEIDTRQLRQPILTFVASGRPLLGTCLGMQLLMGVGEEDGIHAGLGLIPGRVTRLAGEGLRVPHVGWNVLNMTRPHPIYEGIKKGRDFYFVHSYAAVCEDGNDLLGSTEYGGPVTAVIGRANVVGIQFHPEKSQVNGLRMIENFCNWDGRC